MTLSRDGRIGGCAGWLMAAVSALALVGLASAADIPLRLAKRGVPVVDVAINDRGPFAMILDTAAGLSTVTTGLKDELSLTNIGRMPQPAQLASGTEPVDLYTMGTVTIAGVQTQAPLTVILDAPLKFVREARGIVGMNVLSRFAVDIDQPNGRLILSEPGTVPQAGGEWSMLPVEKRWDSFLIVTLTVDGVKARALIDTGANQTILNAALAEKLGIVAGADGVSEGKIASAGKAATLKAQLDAIEMGATVWKSVDIQASDLGLFKVLGLSDGPALILGNDVLKQVRLFVDYKGNQVFVTRPAASALVGEDVVPGVMPVP